MMQILNEENVKSTKASVLTQSAKAIEDCIKLSVDTNVYGYKIMKSMKKIKTGAFIMNVRIYLKHSPNTCKVLMFVIDKDTKTNLIHVSIIDNNFITPTILFSTSDEYPITKLEKYIPSIIISTQNMIK